MRTALRIKGVTYDSEKFKELLLYVAEKSVTDDRFGSTKLNKILFFSDFLAYGQFGRPITGATYQRLEHGPAPSAMVPVRRDLEDRGDAEVVSVPRGPGWVQQRLIPKRRANLKIFTAEEIALVDWVIDQLREHTATSASRLSHEEMGWKLVGDNEDIPYEFVFLSPDKPTEADHVHAYELAQQLGLATS